MILKCKLLASQLIIIFGSATYLWKEFCVGKKTPNCKNYDFGVVWIRFGLRISGIHGTSIFCRMNELYACFLYKPEQCFDNQNHHFNSGRVFPITIRNRMFSSICFSFKLWLFLCSLSSLIDLICYPFLL